MHGRGGGRRHFPSGAHKHTCICCAAWRPRANTCRSSTLGALCTCPSVPPQLLASTASSLYSFHPSILTFPMQALDLTHPSTPPHPHPQGVCNGR